ncbi:MAG: RNA-binding protein [Desulfarculaceae bacterium]|jgi:RNA recognition motif-containing protein
MMVNIFVGNLPYSSTEAEVRELFEQFGEVHSAKVIMDRYTGKSRGFGFVEMEQEAAEAAIGALDGKDFGGRPLRVNEAREQKRRSEPRSQDQSW